jgi:translation initiation factor 4A
MTSACIIPMLELIDCSLMQCQAIMLVPRREIAVQNTNITSELGTFIPNIKICACINTNATVRETIIRNVEEGVHIVIGTPTAVHDLITRGSLNCSAVRLLVLDSADEMIGHGFDENILDIVGSLRDTATQRVVCTSTQPIELMEFLPQIVHNPIQIKYESFYGTLEGVKQFHISIPFEMEKFDTLCDLYNEAKQINPNVKLVIFCQSATRVKFLAKKMMNKNETDTDTDTTSFVTSNIICLSDPQDYQVRKDALNAFKSSSSSTILITVDGITRVFDYQTDCLVINYDLPKTSQQYLERIGRAGCFGRKSVTINFIASTEDVILLRSFEKAFHIEIDDCPHDVADHM